jgi:hypothetical protein
VDVPDVAIPLPDLPMAEISAPPLRRTTRASRPSARVRDVMPGMASIEVQASGFYGALDNGYIGGCAPEEHSLQELRPAVQLEPIVESAAPNYSSHVSMDTNKTYGIRRIYTRHPLAIPDLHADKNLLFAPATDQVVARSSRTVTEIIAPYPNITSWRWNHLFWSIGDARSIKFRDHQQLLARHSDYNPIDYAKANFKSIEDKVRATKTNPWSNVEDGWRQVDLTIGVPVGIPRTQTEIRDARNRKQRARRNNPDVMDAPPPSVEGQPYVVEGAWMRSLTGVIKRVWEHDPLTRQFHTDGYEERGPRPGTSRALPGTIDSAQEERVMREVYDSPEFQRLEEEAQAKLGSTTKRRIVIIALMFWSDATHLAQFGTAKLWPVYMYFGNLSKYIRTKRSAKAAYHVAYLPTVSVILLLDNAQN